MLLRMHLSSRNHYGGAQISQDQAYKTIQMTEESNEKIADWGPQKEKERCNIKCEIVLLLHGMSACWSTGLCCGWASLRATCWSWWSCSWSFSLTGFSTWLGSHEKQTLGVKVTESYSLFPVELLGFFDSFFLQTSFSLPAGTCVGAGTAGMMMGP